jgi:hypothetical protein
MSARRILELSERVCELSERVRELETQNEQLIALNAVMDDILECFDGCTTLTAPQVESASTTNTQLVDRGLRTDPQMRARCAPMAGGLTPCSVQAMRSMQ